MERPNRTLAAVVVLLVAAVASGGLAATAAADGGSAVSTQADCSYPMTVTDATGTEVTLEERPERIVVLQPSDAQIVWEIGASDRVVGMAQGPTTGYLENREGITDVKNDDGTVNVEQVTNLSADVVLAADVTQSGTVDQLRQTDTPVYQFGLVRDMNHTYRNINTTGQLVGNCEGAADTVASMRERLDRIDAAIGDAERPSVLYTFFGYAAGNNTHVNSMIERAGGQNVVAEYGESGYPQVSREMIAANDPEWIVYPTDATAPSGAPYNETTALEDGNVSQVNTNFINQAGPRNVDAVATMAQQFHPNAFDENGEPITPTPTPTPTATATQTATSTPTATDTAMATASPTDDATPATTEGSGPGFTPVLAVMAVLGGLLALGRRREGL